MTTYFGVCCPQPICGQIALYLAFLAEPFFNTQMDCHLNLNKQFNLSFTTVIILIICGTGFISGIAPAIVVNKVNPIAVVSGSFKRKVKSLYSRVLIAFQYIVAIILLISTLTIALQSKFMQNFNLGFNKENLFWMENSISPNQKTAFRDLLKSIGGVTDVSFCRGTPIDGGNNQSFNYKDKPVSFQEFLVDSVYFNLMGMKVTKTDAAFAKNGVWLNMAAVQLLELGKNPVSFRYYDRDVPVLGIITDFNFRSLHTKIGPLIVRQLKEEDEPWSILVKLNGPNLLATVDEIRKDQASFSGNSPCRFWFC